MIATLRLVLYLVASYPIKCEKIRHLIPFARTSSACKEPHKQAQIIIGYEDIDGN